MGHAPHLQRQLAMRVHAESEGLQLAVRRSRLLPRDREAGGSGVVPSVFPSIQGPTGVPTEVVDSPVASSSESAESSSSLRRLLKPAV